jgi:hypothetical protein
MNKKIWIFCVLLLLIAALFFLGRHKKVDFNRDSRNLIYTKHAKCRMYCRHVDESEILEILQKGEINYSKSNPGHRPDPTYALEGITHDRQHVRVIFAESHRGLVVVTCIDLNKDWSCDCQ